MAHDIVIRGGTVVDGSGKSRFGAAVGIKDGRIGQSARTRQNAERPNHGDGPSVPPGLLDGRTPMAPPGAGGPSSRQAPRAY